MKIFKQISILAFAALYFVVSTGFRVSMHYCDGQFADFAIIAEKATCSADHHHEGSKSSCCTMHHPETHHQNEGMDGMDCNIKNSHQCCTDKSIYLHLDTKPVISKADLNLKPIISTILFKINLVLDEIPVETDFKEHKFDLIKTYSPPDYLRFQQLKIFA